MYVSSTKEKLNGDLNIYIYIYVFFGKAHPVTK